MQQGALLPLLILAQFWDLLGDVTVELPGAQVQMLLQGLSLSHGWRMVRMERTEEVTPQAPTQPGPVG